MAYTHKDLASEELNKILLDFKPKKVLEIGIGETPLKEHFDGVDYTAIDKMPRNKEYCKTMDVHDMSFEDDTFDLVLMCHVAEHFIDPLTALREIYRVLKPEGKVINITPNDCEHQILTGDADHLFVLSSMQWRKLFLFASYKNVTSYKQMTYKNEQIKPIQNYNIITQAEK